ARPDTGCDGRLGTCGSRNRRGQACGRSGRSVGRFGTRRRRVWRRPAPSHTASAAATPVPNKGDTAWMTVATALVIFMTIPGLALFYGGLVRSKNMLSVLMQVFICVCMIALLWFAYGYSVAFTNGTPYYGGLTKAFLAGVNI